MCLRVPAWLSAVFGVAASEGLKKGGTLRRTLADRGPEVFRGVEGEGGELDRHQTGLGHHRPRTPCPVHFNLTIIPASSIRPAPTLLTAAPIAFANGSGHDIDRAAFDAGTTLRDAGGREGGHRHPTRIASSTASLDAQRPAPQNNPHSGPRLSPRDCARNAICTRMRPTFGEVLS